jgi:hypothetical protein
VRSSRSLLVAIAAASALWGLAACGGSQSSTGDELRARRADLAKVVGALLAARAAVARETAAAHAAWPLIDRGLPRPPAEPKRHHGARTERQRRLEAAQRARRRAEFTRRLAAAKRALAAASAAGAELPPQLVSHPEELTGAGSPIAGVYEAASGLTANSSAQVAAALSPSQDASPAARAFQRANVNTYIVSFYDGNFDMSLLGKMVQKAYERLGGAKEFGGRLTQQQLAEVEAAYSPAAAELRPHPWQGLVSH